MNFLVYLHGISSVIISDLLVTLDKSMLLPQVNNI